MKSTVFNAIMKKVSAGNVYALSAVYEEYYKKLNIVAFRILHDRDLACDAASETVLRLIEDAQKGWRSEVKYVSGYLCAMCKNLSLKMKEKLCRSTTIDDVREHCADVADFVISNADLTGKLMRLKDVEREVGLMFYVYGYKIREISESLGMPVGTVKWHISNIKKKIGESATESRTEQKD